MSTGTPGERDSLASDVPVHPPTPRIGMDYVPFPSQGIEPISKSGEFLNSSLVFWLRLG